MVKLSYQEHWAFIIILILINMSMIKIETGHIVTIPPGSDSAFGVADQHGILPISVEVKEHVNGPVIARARLLILKDRFKVLDTDTDYMVGSWCKPAYKGDASAGYFVLHDLTKYKEALKSVS